MENFSVITKNGLFIVIKFNTYRDPFARSKKTTLIAAI